MPAYSSKRFPQVQASTYVPWQLKDAELVFVQGMLVPCPSQRMTADATLEHAYFKTVGAVVAGRTQKPCEGSDGTPAAGGSIARP